MATAVLPRFYGHIGGRTYKWQSEKLVRYFFVLYFWVNFGTQAGCVRLCRRTQNVLGHCISVNSWLGRLRRPQTGTYMSIIWAGSAGRGYGHINGNRRALVNLDYGHISGRTYKWQSEKLVRYFFVLNFWVNFGIQRSLANPIN